MSETDIQTCRWCGKMVKIPKRACGEMAKCKHCGGPLFIKGNIKEGYRRTHEDFDFRHLMDSH